MKFLVLEIVGLWMFVCLYSCSRLEPVAPNGSDILDGPVEGLSYEQNQRFLAGDFAFNNEIFTSAKGLGPIFVTNSCGSCHAGDGKGHPFSTLTRFGQTDSTGNKFLHVGGPQLQNRAIPGYTPEKIPAGASFSRFTPPANTGLGFLELVPDADIMAMADPDDVNGDGISGVVNWCNMPSFITPSANTMEKNGKYIGRFGKKGAAYNLLHQTVNAYNQDMGIASVYDPTDVYTNLAIDPEISTKTIHDVVFYLQTLKAPQPRNQQDPEVISGKNTFISIGCEKCHRQTLQSGYSPVAPLSNQVFHPYTDMLLHDMGPGLDDGYTEGSAMSSEWRTPPLWGLGLSPNSQGGKYFLMHDGRAGSIEEAIGMHGGEAAKSRDNFNRLSEMEKNALIRFLKSL